MRMRMRTTNYNENKHKAMKSKEKETKKDGKAQNSINNQSKSSISILHKDI